MPLVAVRAERRTSLSGSTQKPQWFMPAYAKPDGGGVPTGSTRDAVHERRRPVADGDDSGARCVLVAACVTMPDGFVRSMMKASVRQRSEAVPHGGQGRHGPERIGETAGAHRLLAGQTEGARERLVEDAGVQATDADLDEHDVGAIEGTVERGLGGHAAPHRPTPAGGSAGFGHELQLLRWSDRGGRSPGLGVALLHPATSAMASISSGVEAPLPPSTVSLTVALIERRRSRGSRRRRARPPGSLSSANIGQAEQARHERAGDRQLIGGTPGVAGVGALVGHELRIDELGADAGASRWARRASRSGARTVYM